MFEMSSKIRHRRLDGWKYMKSFISRLFHHHSTRKNPPIFELPECLIRDIFERLPLVDQVCLSLNCQLYYYLFGAVTKRKEFHFPRLLHIMDPRLCMSKPDVPRNQLLNRLKHRPWVFCSGCLKLHPWKQFEDKRTARDLPYMKRRCMPYARIVDICPCLSLTVRHRWRIVNSLKALTGDTDAARRPGIDLQEHTALFEVGVHN